MARYKTIDLGPRLFAVDLKKQLLLGRFSQAIDHRLDHNVDRTGFDSRYRLAMISETGCSYYSLNAPRKWV